MMLQMGNAAKGTRAVTGIGMASDIHQQTIKSVIAAVFCAGTLIPVGVGIKYITQKRIIPIQNSVFNLTVEVKLLNIDKIIAKYISNRQQGYKRIITFIGKNLRYIYFQKFHKIPKLLQKAE
jgi:hypothetical protein